MLLDSFDSGVRVEKLDMEILYSFGFGAVCFSGTDSVSTFFVFSSFAVGSCSISVVERED